MKCTSPVCIYYYEVERSDTPRKAICLWQENMEINYTNIEKINACQSYKIFKQLKENWKNLTC